MSRTGLLFKKPDEPQTYALLRRHDDFGFEELDLLRPPGRFWSDGEAAPPGAEMHVDSRRVPAVATPAELLAAPDTSMAMTRRSLARLSAWFLIVEDPQRRLEAQPIVTLAHQASVVQHIAEQPSLRRVLLADEVGLGKTIEAGLLIKRFVAQKPLARILYLAPARLVRNVRIELDKLGLAFRSWVATAERDATLKDPRIVASIHRACHEGRIDEVLKAPQWDMIIADECHHLSDWAPGGGSPVAQYRLVDKLAQSLAEDGRLLLMSGTPHQGHPDRFKNVVALLRAKHEPESVLAGRVIYRTKDDVRDWEGQPLFPGRQVNPPLILDLGRDHRAWLGEIHEFFEPGSSDTKAKDARRRAAGWRAGQALQWATSSVQAGLGYLVRQAIRAHCKPESLPALATALGAIRPYRLGPADEPIDKLFVRIVTEVDRQLLDADVEDIEDLEDTGKWRPDLDHLSRLLEEGVRILKRSADAKWEFLYERVLSGVGDEKAVLFAQPIETVTAVAAYLQRKTGRPPALILGGQSDAERAKEVESFWRADGPQFLVSSRAGGEGLNLQVARRLVHLDVPWNPMELEQRIGRVHRFMSRKTILVDTIVVKDSREVDTYGFARQKLKTIASALVPEDRFDALFGRVMSLVPPEELQDVLGHAPLGPLSPADQDKIAELVIKGFQQWKQFHERYSKQRREIQTLDPGEASWLDLGVFARQHLGATSAEGFSALRFLWKDGEAVSAQHDAEVLRVGGKPFACGDYGGMPVTSDAGGRAEQLGTNVAIVTKALRAQAFPAGAVGAAQVRWPEDAARPHSGTFGVLVCARQSVRWEQGTYAEHGASLYCAIVTPEGKRTAVEGRAKGALVRGLLRSTIRRDAENARLLVEALRTAETAMFGELRMPTEADRHDRVVHAVTPLLAAVVS
jgi:superfamily II DNA or RNA helicase